MRRSWRVTVPPLQRFYAVKQIAPITPQQELQFTIQVDRMKEGLRHYNSVYLSSILKMHWWCGCGVNIANGPILVYHLISRTPILWFIGHQYQGFQGTNTTVSRALILLLWRPLRVLLRELLLGHKYHDFHGTNVTGLHTLVLTLVYTSVGITQDGRTSHSRVHAPLLGTS